MSICSGCVGRPDFGALVAEGAKRGHFDRCVCNAAVVDIRPQ